MDQLKLITEGNLKLAVSTNTNIMCLLYGSKGSVGVASRVMGMEGLSSSVAAVGTAMVGQDPPLHFSIV